MAFCLFPVFLFIPGYVLAATLNVLQFRTRSIAGQGALSIALSVSVVPIVTYLISRAFSLRTALGLYGVVAMIFVAIIIRHSPGLLSTLFDPSRMNGNRLLKRSFAWVFGWTFIALLLLSDVQIGQHLYPSIVSFDYAKHIAVTDAITRTGIPPVNPSFFPGQPVELYYYYFWFQLCSLVNILGGTVIQARAAVIGGTVWSGIALFAAVALYLRFMTPGTYLSTGRTFFIGLGLLLITGFDILPILAKMGVVTGSFVNPTVEWWNDQVAAWVNAMLWVPHHVAALVAVLTGFLLFRTLEGHPFTFRKTTVAILCAFSIASALGMSVWVTFSFCLFWVVWILLSLVKGWGEESRYAILSGIIAAIISIPFLMDLKRADLLHAWPITWSIKSFYPVEHYLRSFGAGERRIQVFNLLFLPINYFLELGFFALAGCVYWSRRCRSAVGITRTEMAFATMALSATIVASLLRSNIRSNDLGWRSFMLVQFPLLIWSASVVDALLDRHRRNVALQRSFDITLTRRWSHVLVFALLIGTLPVLYDVVMMKAYPMRDDLLALGQPLISRNEGRRMYGIREVYDWINQSLPREAIVQHNPDIKDGDLLYQDRRIDIFHGLYGHRQVVAADPEYGTLFGIPPVMYKAVASSIAPLFADPPAVDEGLVQKVCKQFGISALVVKDTDPIWKNPEGWVWKEKPLFGNDVARVLACGHQ